MSRADDGRPLSGVAVLVTRTVAQSGKLISALEDLGADVLATPVIEIVDPDDWGPADAAIHELDTYDWVVLTSTNAVERFLARVDHAGRRVPAGSPGAPSNARGMRIAAVGPATADRCRDFGIEPDLIPDEAIGEGLIAGFEELGVGPGVRVLLPRALKAREVLPDTLRERGATVDVVPVYRTADAAPDPDIIEALAAGSIDAVTFTSPSTVRSFFRGIAGTPAEGPARALMFASIGPVTSAALHDLGLTIYAEALEHTTHGLAQALALRVTGGSSWA